MKERNFDEIIEETKKEVILFGYSETSIKEYQGIFDGLLLYVKDKNISYYDYNISLNYFKQKYHLKDINIKDLNKYQLKHLRVFKMLDDIYNGENIKCQYNYKPKTAINDVNNNILEEFVEYTHKIGLSKNIIKGISRISRNFLVFLENENINNINQVNYECILSYINTFPPSRKSKNLYLYYLRTFLNYLYEKNMIKENLSVLLPNYKIVKQNQVPSIWNLEEVKLLLSSIDRTDAKGIRNYAIILLAITTGMRGIDIINLKIQDIEFRDNKISFIQEKTKKYIELPLLSSTKNALKNYILEVRPKTDYNNVFLNLHPIPRPLTNTASLTGMIQRYVEELKLDTNQKRGIHSFRHTVLNHLFNDNETSLITITDISGHIKPKSLNSYIKTDIEHLKEFTLNIKDFGGKNE